MLAFEADIPKAAAVICLQIGWARMVMRAVVMALDQALLHSTRLRGGMNAGGEGEDGGLKQQLPGHDQGNAVLVSAEPSHRLC